MRGRVIRRNRLIKAAPDDCAIRSNDHCTNRNLSGSQCATSFLYRLPHEFLVHFRMLNYSAMKSLRGLVFALLLLPVPGLAQGVRMSADFLPLEVGKRWTYEVTNQAGQ